MKLNTNQKAFFALVRAGLWEKSVSLSQLGLFDFDEVYILAEEQAVVGLVAAGIEHIADLKVPQEVALTFAGGTLQLEQRNRAMNSFVGLIVEKLRDAGIYTLLVKGQGIGQCYERPLWRSCGDVDFFLSEDNYNKAVSFFRPLAYCIEKEDPDIRHMGMVLDGWEVELHGTLRSKLWRSIDQTLDDVQNDIFFGGSVRSWIDEDTQVFLPRADEDVFYVFSHILHHYYQEGIGLRQVCDWCRLLWKYRGKLDLILLESRLKKACVMNEWKTFAALAVNALGMPVESMPFYDSNNKWKRKAENVLAYILESGNFGHNKDMSFRYEESAFKRKTQTFWFMTSNSIKHFDVFPLNSVKVWWNQMRIGLLTLVVK